MKHNNAKGFDWSTANPGEIIHKLGLIKSGGRIWELYYGRVKIVRINDKTIRINRIDDNGGRGNEWAVPKQDLLDTRNSYSRDKAALFKKYVPRLKEYADKAQAQLDGYTKKHPRYDWYLYTRNIMRDFYELFRDGYTQEKYLEIKRKYADFETKELEELFGRVGD